MSSTSFSHLITDETLLQCMHCGLCLPSCPTYSLTQLERYSPRGRIQLARSVFEGSISSETHYKDIADSINTCLGCLACESACPAGVEYESIFESTKNLIQQSDSKQMSTQNKILELVMKFIFPNPDRFKFLSRIIRFTQKHISVKLIPKKLIRTYTLAPIFSEPFFDDGFKTKIVSTNETVMMLSGCVMNTAFADVHRDTVKVLNYVGLNVTLPKSQVCCGALHAHNGFMDEAKELAKKNIDAFSGSEKIVVNSAGCGAMMKNYAKLFDENDDYFQRAKSISERVKDLSEILTEKHFSVGEKIDQSITYHDACHLEYGQKIKNEPRDLLKSCYSNYQELNSPMCCGSAGIYNLLQEKISEELLSYKTNAIIKTNAVMVVTGNPGCLLQLNFGMKKNKMQVQVVHLATALAKAIE